MLLFPFFRSNFQEPFLNFSTEGAKNIRNYRSVNEGTEQVENTAEKSAQFIQIKNRYCNPFILRKNIWI